jgi:hypothetical protein
MKSLKLTGSVASVERLTEIVQELLPMPEDLISYVGMTQLVPALSVVTVRLTTREYYDFYIRRLYVDAASGCTYTWRASDVYFRVGAETLELDGNDHTFFRRVVLRGGGYIELEIANASPNDYELDIVVDMWARPFKFKTVKEE